MYLFHKVATRMSLFLAAVDVHGVSYPPSNIATTKYGTIVGWANKGQHNTTAGKWRRTTWPYAISGNSPRAHNAGLGFVAKRWHSLAPCEQGRAALVAGLL